MGWNMVLIMIFIGFQLVRSIVERNSDCLSFYFYRYHHPLFPTNKKRKELYRNHSVILKRTRKEINEHEWLKEMFS